MQASDLLFVLTMYDSNNCAQIPSQQMWRDVAARCGDNSRINNICNFVHAVCEAFDAGKRVAKEDRWLAVQCCMSVLHEREHAQ